MRRPLFALCCGVLAAVASLAAARDAKAQRDTVEPSRARTTDGRAYRIDAIAATNAPLDVGVRGVLETPVGFRVSSSVGVLPGVYASGINDLLVSTGSYDAEVGRAVRSSLSSSFVWRTHVGVRPFARLGLYLDAGYGLVRVGGDLSESDAAAAAGVRAPDRLEGARYTVDATLHMLDVELGWHGRVLNDRLVLVAAIGVAATVGATTRVDRLAPPGTTTIPGLGAVATRAYADEAEATLDSIFRRYGVLPVATVGIGYSFL
jgi:hypothetical protein